jgi:hypothetical protein
MVVRGRGSIGVSYRGRGGPSGWHDAGAVGAAAVGRHDRDGLMLRGGSDWSWSQAIRSERKMGPTALGPT